MHPSALKNTTHTYKKNCSILTDATRLIVNQELSGLSSLIKPFYLHASSLI